MDSFCLCLRHVLRIWFTMFSDRYSVNMVSWSFTKPYWHKIIICCRLHRGISFHRTRVDVRHRHSSSAQNSSISAFYCCHWSYRDTATVQRSTAALNFVEFFMFWTVLLNYFFIFWLFCLSQYRLIKENLFYSRFFISINFE